MLLNLFSARKPPPITNLSIRHWIPLHSFLITFNKVLKNCNKESVANYYKYNNNNNNNRFNHKF